MSRSDPLQPDRNIIESLLALGLIENAETARFEALTGGVSSDIWKIDTDTKTFCVKRALPKLKVQANWQAPVERNHYEVMWYQHANRYVPGSAPNILAQDETAMLCAMEFLAPETHKLWKAELMEGRVNVDDACRLGDMLGQIHRRASADQTLSESFPPNDIFHAIRLEPYLEATALKHPDLKDRLFDLSARTNQTKLTMIHGDVSPKNILIGPDGPVILDAECACIGDPAFDLAFCLNHFLLKCLWLPAAKEAFLGCFKGMSERYLKEVSWEDPSQLEERAASLLPGLFLARVDGKSPVEYITEETDKDKVRRTARALLFNPPSTLEDVAENWQQELSR